MDFKNVIIVILVAFISLPTLRTEVFPEAKGFDKYGVYLSIKLSATGRFHLEKVNGRHFLLTPDGHGFLSLGVTHTGKIPHLKKSSCDYFKDDCKSNWQNANEELLIHFRNLGYNSLGYDNNASTKKYLPHFGSCSPAGKSEPLAG
ncbi:MAG: hypothetical protein MK132_20345 [Lentisphaerales bacterium]|nr:hypothetical protein [Lentisphaerales bacterium]